jgi:hypothetical protein
MQKRRLLVLSKFSTNHEEFVRSLRKMQRDGLLVVEVFIIHFYFALPCVNVIVSAIFSL